MRSIICTTLAAIALLAAAPASADPDGDYLALLSGQPGYLGGAVNNAVYVNTGHRACDALHGGASREDTIAQITTPPWITTYQAHIITDAAQTAICPDTKH